MKIVCNKGLFLHEGLRDLGHEVHDISFVEHLPVNEQIAAVCASPDLVFLELFGNIPLPRDFYKCAFRTAAYCVDSSINSFFLSDLLHLFDTAFVDQESAVAELKKYGIRAAFLPLCVPDRFFRPQEEKKIGISFIGHVDDQRKKRKNLLAFLQKHHQVNVFCGISPEEAQDIFARSKITLNENLFSGLTLRIFQGLASGSLVLTEKNTSELSAFFQDGRHLVCYSPENVLEIIEDILAFPEKYQAIAQAGQKECLARHTSRHRAGELLARLAPGRPSRGKSQRELAVRLAVAQYALRLRFGGDYGPAVKSLTALSAENDQWGALAAYTLGNIHARRLAVDAAIHFYNLAVLKGLELYPLLKLCLLTMESTDRSQPLSILHKALESVPHIRDSLKDDLRKLESAPSFAASLLLVIARIYSLCGKIFHPGFKKPFQDFFPDTALELALLSWARRPMPETLDLMLECARQYRIEGEMLPYLLQAAESGLATKEQVRQARAIAESYYDFELQKKLESVLGTFGGLRPPSPA